MTFTLTCCGRTDPIGVDKLNIRLSFGTDGSAELRSYEITLREADSGRLVWVRQGTPADGFTAMADPAALQDATGYTWQVRAVLADGTAAASQTAFFETGICQWQGKWIGLPAQPGQVLEFRKDITLGHSPTKARLYICGLGFFQPKLNGLRLDERYFIPPLTDYATRPQIPYTISGHRVTYYTYDVTELLRSGSNVLTAQVSDGYYGNWEKAGLEPQPDMGFGQPGLIYELHIQDRSGLHRIVSDSDTQARPTNEVSRLYSGDMIDFTREEAPYVPASLISPPDGVMTSPMCGEDRVARILTPVASWKTEAGTVYDFGVNHSGGLRFTALANRETTLRIRFAEVRNEDGSLNFDTGTWYADPVEAGAPICAPQENTYRLKPGANEIEPKFGWFCYRYALIPDEVQIRGLCSLFIHMDVEQNGSFSCAEPLLEQIHDMFVHTLRCNMHAGVLSDCPHRERLPYTGDGSLVMKSACYSLDATGFFYKWFRDLLDTQTADGLVPNSAPYMGGGGGYAWGNALCTASRLLYQLTGDKTAARQGYGAICRWLEYYESKRDEDYIIRSNSHTWLLGDWLAPEVVTSNVYYISTVCYLQAAKTALFFAGILEPADCEKWQALTEKITEGINRVFFNEKTRTYGNGVQGENMLALAEGIVPEAYRSQMEADLRHHYTVETDYHLDTGIVLTPVLIEYLTDHGFRDIAWRIMTAKTYPSYYNLMENDTTFSEHWSKKWPDYYFGENGNSRLVKGGGDLSHCHPMYGSVAAWLYERVAGLDLSQLYRKRVYIKPYFMDQLTWAKAEKTTPFGKVSVAWTREDGRLRLTLSVPQGLTAYCCFPAQCRGLINPFSNAIYKPDQTGAFQFTLGAGQWILEEEKQ
ncbi:MAG: family 78 glycoside hydrolase catalytic domain [Oscillospiraceae bacterium]|nr:family 78 glycoside hydrolase catalytic domain [Oscillospiraceae bacterium]